MNLIVNVNRRLLTSKPQNRSMGGFLSHGGTMKACFLILVQLVFAGTVLATDVEAPKLGGGETAIFDSSPFSFSLFDSRYQVGSEWGKLPVTKEILNKSSVIRRAALATARVGGATGFYLGKFNGAHVVATNKHVCPSRWSCRGRVRFPLLNNASFKAVSVLGRFPEIDLAFVEISVRPEAEAQLREIAGNFSFSNSLTEGRN